MDGVDTAWIDAGQRRTVSYGPLAGAYRFRLRAASQDGPWTQVPTTWPSGSATACTRRPTSCRWPRRWRCSSWWR
ncbi:MAG: hypothetical protein IPF77_11065 [Gemmatimonadetes bacterium]|nr:hypothetical protein [Gemmatimonadota bacterium]